MKAEHLSEAFYLLDDDIIETVDLVRQNPSTVKRKRTNWIAMAACLCLLFTAAILSRSMHIGSDGTEDIMVEDASDDNFTSAENSNLPLVTIPDYSHWIEDSNKIEYYDLARDNGSETDKAEPESKSNSKDYSSTSQLYLPVFKNMTLNSSIILVNSIEELGNQLKTLTEYEKVGTYPILTISDAILYLTNGKCLTFEDSEMELAEEFTSKLVYLYDKEADIAIPFYHFTVDNGGADKSNINGWFVPAISDEYITNMPEIGVVE